jgi:CcmD family protein
MYKKVHSWFLFLLFLLTGHFVRAQDTATGKPVEMADRLRADGKIYVVIVVLLTIFLGIVAYVIRLDRKISRLEKGGK